MMSRSYTNLLDLAAGNFEALGPAGGGRRRSFGAKRMTRVMTVPGTLSELDDEDDEPAATSSVAGGGLAPRRGGGRSRGTTTRSSAAAATASPT